MRRLNLWTAMRAGIVLVLMLSVMSGFADSGDLTLGTAIGGGPPSAGSGIENQLSGEIIGLDTFQNPPLLLVRTTTGSEMYVQLSDPAWIGGLGLGVSVTFGGSYLSADLFNATQMITNTLGSGGGDLTLGSALTSSSLSGGLITTSSSDNNDNSDNDNSSDCSDNDNSSTTTSTNANGNNSDCPTPTPTPSATPTKTLTPSPTPTQTACVNTQTLTLSPVNGTATVSTNYSVQVTVQLSGNCSGKTAYLQFISPPGPNYSATALSATVSTSNVAIFNWTGSATTGIDNFQVWLELDGTAGVLDPGDPKAIGSVEWKSASPSILSRTSSTSSLATPTRTPAATATKTPAPTKTPEPTKTPAPTKTPEPTKTLSKSKR